MQIIGVHNENFLKKSNKIKAQKCIKNANKVSILKCIGKCIPPDITPIKLDSTEWLD